MIFMFHCLLEEKNHMTTILAKLIWEHISINVNNIIINKILIDKIDTFNIDMPSNTYCFATSMGLINNKIQNLSNQVKSDTQ